MIFSYMRQIRNVHQYRAKCKFMINTNRHQNNELGRYSKRFVNHLKWV